MTGKLRLLVFFLPTHTGQRAANFAKKRKIKKEKRKNVGGASEQYLMSKVAVK